MFQLICRREVISPILGSGFDEAKEDNIIQISNQTCKVLEATATELICELPARDSLSQEKPSEGVRGMKIFSYDYF